MGIADLCVEYQENPIGIDIACPRFSWKMESGRTNTMQTGFQIQVMSEGQKIWDSGRQKSDQSVLVEYSGPPLEAGYIYTYRVAVWDNHGETAQADGTF